MSSIPPSGMGIGVGPSYGLGPSLADFKAAAASAAPGASVQLSLDGQSLQVLAQGEFNAGGPTRSVAWVGGDSGTSGTKPEPGAPGELGAVVMSDTAAALLKALQQATGDGVSRAVAKELGLSAAPGKPLDARVVEAAAQMAETATVAMQGVAFLQSTQTTPR
jgi:hypothetical protein